MHKYPEYTYTSYDLPHPRRRRIAATLAAFASAGFLFGLVFLIVRNLHLLF